MPLAVFLAAAAFTAVATGINLARVQKLSGASTHADDDKFGLWQKWQLGAGLIGLSVVPQVGRAGRRGRRRLRGSVQCPPTQPTCVWDGRRARP